MMKRVKDPGFQALEGPANVQAMMHDLLVLFLGCGGGFTIWEKF